MLWPLDSKAPGNHFDSTPSSLLHFCGISNLQEGVHEEKPVLTGLRILCSATKGPFSQEAGVAHLVVGVIFLRFAKGVGAAVQHFTGSTPGGTPRTAYVLDGRAAPTRIPAPVTAAGSCALLAI